MIDNKMDIIELIVDETNPELGVGAYSFVHTPATETMFVAFNKEYITDLATLDEEKRLVIGPALIPNQMILRKDDASGKMFYIYFSKDTIRRTSQMFLSENNSKNATLEHTSPIEGVSIVESWIIEDMEHDKSSLYGFKLPAGTWMLTSKVTNDELWEQIKAGDVKGFSIEGRFVSAASQNQSEVEQSVVTPEDVEELELIGTDEERELYREIVALIEELELNEETELVDLSDEMGNTILSVLPGEIVDEEWELVDSRESSDKNSTITEWANAKIQEINLATIGSYPNEPSVLDENVYKVRYSYSERHSSDNSRGFCKDMMKRTGSGVVYRLEDISLASDRGINKDHGHNGQPYDLFKYKGGVNCGHYFTQNLYRLKTATNGEFVEDKSLSSSEQTAFIPGYDPSPEGEKESVIAPKDMPRNGHHPDF